MTKPTATSSLLEQSQARARSIARAERDRLGFGADATRWPRAFGAPAVSGRLRTRPEDFVVDEQLPFALDGSGEHLYVRVRKSGQNTNWVARQLARRLDLPARAIGYAGLKDRHAVTSQWFSLHLPGRPDPDPAAWDIDGVVVVDAVRHRAKLRTGALRANRFRLVIRELAGDMAALATRLEQLRAGPVPNYFGAQRFGHAGGNLDLLCDPGRSRDRHARSFGLSALRAAMFNGWLAQRVAAGTWLEPMTGEILYRPADGGFVHAARFADDEVAYPTGLLWGVGPNRATDAAASAEREFFDAFPDTCAILTEFGARTMRRSLGIAAGALDYVVGGDAVELSFSLPAGAFATALIRELGDFFDSA